MMLFDLCDDREATHVRRAIWADPLDHVELPPCYGDVRGPWFFLHAYDVEKKERIKRPILFMELLDDHADDWEVYRPSSQAGKSHDHE